MFVYRTVIRSTSLSCGGRPPRGLPSVAAKLLAFYRARAADARLGNSGIFGDGKRFIIWMRFI